VTNVLEQITRMVSVHPAAHYVYGHNQGKAPLGYMKGMALTYGRVLCKFNAGDPATVWSCRPATHDSAHDALSYYRGLFVQRHLDIDAGGVVTLRALWVLLTGLAMPESSGKWFCGRDRSANNVQSDTAEAGLFQTSWNAAHNSGPPATQYLINLFTRYGKVSAEAGWLEVFREGAGTADARNLENFGSGAGAAFQKLSKECPAFAAEFAAIVLRALRGHYGTINRYLVELNPHLDAMFQQVEHIIASDPAAFTAALSDTPGVAAPSAPPKPVPIPRPVPAPAPPTRIPPMPTPATPLPGINLAAPILSLVAHLLPPPLNTVVPALLPQLPTIIQMAQADIAVAQQIEAAPDLPSKIGILAAHLQEWGAQLQAIVAGFSAIAPTPAKPVGLANTEDAAPGPTAFQELEESIAQAVRGIAQHYRDQQKTAA